MNEFEKMAKRFSSLMQYIEIIRLEHKIAHKCMNCSCLTNSLYSWGENVQVGYGYYCDACWKKEKASIENSVVVYEYIRDIPKYMVEINEELFGV